MSLCEQQDEITVSSKESKKRIDGKRVIDCIELEIAETVQTQHWDGNGRSDWIQGTSHNLSIAQAETLYQKLGKTIAHLRQLESQGHIVLGKNHGN